MKFNWLGSLIFLVLVILQGCSAASDSDDGISGTGGQPNIYVNGTAEKGPFLKRSEVSYKFIDASGASTSSDMSTETSDDMGNFSLGLIESGLVSIRVEGYHFNEVSRQVSDGPLTLTALYYANDDDAQRAKVNVLTHIIRDRALSLIQNGLSFSLAIVQAEQELLSALDSTIPKIAISDFTQLSIYNNGTGTNDGNAYLLLFSAALHQYVHDTTPQGSSETGRLTLILNNLSDDFLDGNLESSVTLLEGLQLAIQQLDPASVITNLQERSEDVLGEKLEVPDFSDYIGQFLITYPAEGASVSSPITVNSEVPNGLKNISLELIVDGEKIEEVTEMPYQFDWNPYFWSNDDLSVGANMHTLLLKAKNSSGSELVSNLVNISVANTSKNQLTLLSPSNQQELYGVDSATLSWDALTGASQYQLQVASDSVFTNVISQTSVIATEYQVSSLDLGDYYWRIRASDAVGHQGAWSNAFSFTINAPSIPVLSLPSNGSAIRDSNTPTLSWDQANHASRYVVELSQASNFFNVLQDAVVEETSYTPSALSGETYYWRVKSIDSVGHESAYSDVSSFEITGPQAPTTITTDWRSSGEQYAVQVNWNAVDNASYYMVELALDENFLSATRSITSSTQNAEVLLDAGKYYGRIVSFNESDLAGEWSETFEVEVGLFKTRLGGSKNDRSREIIQSSDGGYIILAYTNSPEVDESVDELGDDWIIKLNKVGAVSWEYVSKAEGGARFNALTELSDGSIIAVGQDWDSDKAVALKLNSEGEFQWETSYRPDDVSQRYDFSSVVEFDNKIYVSGEEWSAERREFFYLHSISLQDGDIRSTVALPSLSGLTISSVRKLIVTNDNRLAVSGYAMPENSDPDHSWLGGGYLQFLDIGLSQTAVWDNVGSFFYMFVGDVIEFSDGFFAVVGQSDMGGVAISGVNGEGSTFGSYRENNPKEYYPYYMPSITRGETGELYGLFLEDGSLTLMSFNSNLTLNERSYFLNFTGRLESIGLIKEDNLLFTFLINQSEDNGNNYDIVIFNHKN